MNIRLKPYITGEDVQIQVTINTEYCVKQIEDRYRHAMWAWCGKASPQHAAYKAVLQAAAELRAAIRIAEETK